MRVFNTEGPVRPEKHYSIAPLSRLDLGRILSLIRQERYFVLHAPRQTGKTSTLLALRDLLNSGEAGSYRCVYANVEGGQAARDDVGRAIRAVLAQIELRAQAMGDESLVEWPQTLERIGPEAALGAVLTRWAAASPTPLVLLIDEIDCLIGDALLSVLRQLRAGYDERPERFPQSVVLCGVRDVRDYRIHSAAEDALVLGGSAFNIKAQSLRLGDFTRAEVDTLLGQHTEETGQAFSAEALDAVWRQTQGQPWLVNALCERACTSEDGSMADVVENDVLNAQEALILSRETHLDQLADKLSEARVRRVVEPILTGGEERGFTAEDIEYTRDLGLIADADELRIANPIYAEVLPRELTYAAQAGLVQDAAWYLDARGGLDMAALLSAFQVFFRENAEHWIERFDYKEAGPQLLLQAFLQRIVNGGGRIEREYGLGRGRTDLLIIWPYEDGVQRFVVECKLLHPRKALERTIEEGVRQTRGYMDRCAADAGHLVVFDRDPDKPWADKVFCREVREERAVPTPVTVWGM